MKAYVFFLLFFGTFYLAGIIIVLRTVFTSLPPVRKIKITLRINTFIFICGCLMLAVAVLFDVNYLKYEAPMPYSRWKEITFADFRGLKRPGETLDGQSDFAFIVPELNVKKYADRIEVTTYFHPARSYVFYKDLVNDDLLRHELYHLHISEYGARRLRKEIMMAGKNVSDSRLETMRKSAVQYIDSLQSEYDDQSYHSYVSSKQKAWEHLTDSCLKSLSNYENPVIINQQ